MGVRFAGIVSKPTEYRFWSVVTALTVLSLVLFWPLCRFGYFAVDDNAYVVQNQAVRAGLTREGVAWAFTSVGYAANWHPLTWFSLMLDVELFGSDPRGHHLVNILLHVASSLLVLVAFRSLTGALWRSALVATLFAVHPLHVESVAWISERKDVLSALFWLLAMIAYVRYARRPGPARYSVVAASLALGLLAKPMPVTLPLVLILLDWWPLGRIPRVKSAGAAFLEKVPLLALVAISTVMTFLAQSQGGVMAPLSGLAIGYRIGNALTTYLAYILKMFWPINLSFWYPHPGSSLPFWEAAAAGTLLAAASAAAMAAAKRFPFFAVGWCWYLGTLVPVIGLVQVGSQAMADRYTYLPLLGLFLAVVWGVTAVAGALVSGRSALWAGTLVVVGALSLLTRFQVQTWRNSENVFTRAIAVTSDNWMMHNNLGELHLEQGRLAEAAAHFQEAARLKPHYPGIRVRLALALERQGRLDEAARLYEEILRKDPSFPTALYPLGNIMARQGKLREAIANYLALLRLDPGHDGAHNNLGTVLLRQEMLEEALAHFREAVRLNPRNAEARNNLGTALYRKGELAEALTHYQEAVSLQPGYATAMAGCARVHLAQGKRDEAARWFREVLKINPDNTEARMRLGELGL